MFRRMMAATSILDGNYWVTDYVANSSNTTSRSVSFESGVVYATAADTGVDGAIMKYDDNDGSYLDGFELDGAGTIDPYSHCLISDQVFVAGRDTGATDTGFFCKIASGFSSTDFNKEITDSGTNTIRYSSARSGSNLVTLGKSYAGIIGTSDALVTAHSASDGSLSWHLYVGASGVSTNVTNAATDSSGNVFFACSENITNTAINIMKLNSSGSPQWQRSLEDSTYNFSTLDCAVDYSGSVVVVGRLSTADNEVHVAKYNASGAIQWQSRIYHTGYDILAPNVSVDPSGNVYIIARKTGHTSSRIFLAKILSTGGLDWAHEWYHTSETIGLLPGTGAPRIYASSSSVYCTFYSQAAHPTLSYNYGSILKIPTDGSLVGSTYGIYTYATSGASLGSASNTDAAGALSTSTDTVSVATISRTETSPTITRSTTEIV